MNYLLLFFFGLAAGSFINVVALRYRPDQKLEISGRSKCPICRKQLVWYELIPVFSFFLQKGKCRHCGHKLSLQYPLVEILSGLIFVFVPISQISLIGLIIWILIFLLFLLLSIIDFRQFVIPNQINLSLAVLGLFLTIFNFQFSIFNQLPNFSFLGHYAMIFGLYENIWLNRLAAALLGMFFFGAIIVLSRGRAMGWGDFKLAGALGLIFGWPDIVMVLILSFITGALFSILLLIQKKKKIKEAVPFGPFLAIGASLTFFFGYQIIDWYFKLFGL
jgi:leader peptidase (prepilin peptidase)/N-methyltransferase